MAAKTRQPFEEYTVHDELGEHTVELFGATEHANRSLYQAIQSDPRWEYRDMWAYIHGHRETCPLDSWEAVLLDIPHLLSIVEQNGVTHVIDPPADQDGLTADQQAFLQCGGEPVLIHQFEDQWRILE